MAADGHKSETFKIIFLFFNERTKIEINESNSGGDCTITFLGVLLNKR